MKLSTSRIFKITKTELNVKMSFKAAGFKITMIKQLCALVEKILVETFWNMKV